MWLRIEGRPARQFYRDERDLPNLASGVARHELLKSAGTLRSGVDGETPNLSPTLSNDEPELFALPPLGAAATLRDESGVLFAGIVRSVKIDTEQNECSIEVEP